MFGVDRYEARKPERRTNRHIDRIGREPNTRIQLREPRTQQQLLPAPPRTYLTSPQQTNPHTSSATTKSPCTEPRIRANRQTSQPRAHTDPRRRHRRPTRLSHRPQNLRRRRCTRHDLRRRCGRIRVARHRCAWPTRRRRDLRRWNAPRRRAQTVPRARRY
jgi:hypothetical protein